MAKHGTPFTGLASRNGRRLQVVGERGLCGHMFLLAARGLAQRFEHVVCPVPRRIEVAAIECDQPARGFEDRVSLIR